MAVTKVQNRLANTTESTSLSVTPSSTPVAGNLLTIVHFVSGGGDQSTIAGPAGFTKAIGTTTGSSPGDIAIYYKVSAGTESGALTCTNPIGPGSSAYMVFSEWTAGGAFSAPLHKTGSTNGPSGTSGTVAASAVSTVAATFVLAAFGLNGGSGGFGNTWTGGFTQDQTYQARVDIGTKTTTATETSSTTETWTTARFYRAALASFVIPSATPAVPTGLAATAVSSSQINLSWNAVTGATAYGVYRDGVALTLTNPTTTYSDTGLAASSTHTYEVDAAS